jgi:hypothetical protein
MNNPFIIDINVSDYEIVVINELLRMFTLQIVVQVLFYLRNDKIELFSVSFIENTLFIMLGLIVYWFVVNNFIIISNKKEETPTLSNYYQSIYAQNNI